MTNKLNWLRLLYLVGCCGQLAAADMSAPDAAAPPTQWHAKLLRGNDLLGKFRNGETRVAVIVTLAPPARARQKTNWNSAESVRTLRAANHAAADAALNRLNAANHRLRHRFDNLAGFSCELTEQALEQLALDPQVEAIEPVEVMEAHLAQGIALMNALTTRSTYTGTNLAIAICDTGIDYNHPRLGGGAIPNGKVIGGYDFGDWDSNPTPASTQPHGTCCAGIAAGNLGTTNDYIGGVAPGAKLYSLKISYGTSGSASNDSMVAAWDWCVTHKNDDTNNPILVISTSFGGGRYFSTSTGDAYSSAMTAAASNAVAAGITVVGSSGNDGYCDSMGWPACISHVISVGAVYDANFGTYLPCVNAASCATKIASGGCATGYYVSDSTAADKVTAYSNMASFLGVLAPANKCYTADIIGSGGYNTTAGSGGDYYDSFGGTSAACPYTAGAVACLQNAAKVLTGSYLTPAEVRSRLTGSGDMISDTKVAITKPRVNLGNAIATLTLPVLVIDGTITSNTLGNADSMLDPGETHAERIILRNTGGGTASNNVGTLSCTNAGVTILEASAGYPDLAPSVSATNSTPFLYRLSKSIECGTTLQFQLVTTSTGAVATNFFTRFVGQTVAGPNLTNNFDSANVPKSILDVATIYSTNTIVTIGVIDDVNVTVRLNHTWDGDLVLAIQHPDGTEVTLANNQGGNGDNFGTGTCGAGEIRTTFDDETGTAISSGTAPFASSYQPESVLSALDGKTVNGTWRLRISDTGALDVGTLSCWGVRIISHTNSYACTLFNNPPVASNLTFAIHHGASTNLTLTGSDPDSDPITFQTNSLPALGTLSSFNPATGAITYTAPAGVNDGDSFTFITNDGFSNSLAGTVSITVTGTVLTPPQLLVTPANHDFGYVLTGTTVQTSFTVTNLGESLLTGTVNSGGTFDVTGNSATQMLVSITPLSAGAFSSNIVFTSNGGSSTNPVTGIGAIAPVAAFTAAPTSGTAPLFVNFSDLSTGTITNRFWNFGDGATTNTLTNVLTHTYALLGTNSVTLTVTGPVGSSTTNHVNAIIVVPVDGDSDGIPDAWEIAHGLNPSDPADASNDDDGDGFTNLQEYLAGTDPHNATSALHITAITVDSNDVFVTWLGGGGTTNAVEYGTDIGSYSNISDNIVLPTGPDVTTNYPHLGGATNPPPAFYRIRLVP